MFDLILILLIYGQLIVAVELYEAPGKTRTEDAQKRAESTHRFGSVRDTLLRECAPVTLKTAQKGAA